MVRVAIFTLVVLAVTLPVVPARHLLADPTTTTPTTTELTDFCVQNIKADATIQIGGNAGKNSGDVKNANIKGVSVGSDNNLYCTIDVEGKTGEFKLPQWKPKAKPTPVAPTTKPETTELKDFCVQNIKAAATVQIGGNAGRDSGDVKNANIEDVSVGSDNNLYCTININGKTGKFKLPQWQKSKSKPAPATTTPETAELKNFCVQNIQAAATVQIGGNAGKNSGDVKNANIQDVSVGSDNNLYCTININGKTGKFKLPQWQKSKPSPAITTPKKTELKDFCVQNIKADATVQVGGNAGKNSGDVKNANIEDVSVGSDNNLYCTININGKTGKFKFPQWKPKFG